MNDLDAQARALYDACPTPKPAWHQLGDTTKDVWRGYVKAGTQLSQGAAKNSLDSSQR